MNAPQRREKTFDVGTCRGNSRHPVDCRAVVAVTERLNRDRQPRHYTLAFFGQRIVRSNLTERNLTMMKCYICALDSETGLLAGALPCPDAKTATRAYQIAMDEMTRQYGISYRFGYSIAYVDSSDWIECWLPIERKWHWWFLRYLEPCWCERGAPRPLPRRPLGSRMGWTA